MNKVIMLIFVLALSLQVASKESKSFKIPRSSIVEVTDTHSGLIYPLFIKLPKSYDKNINKSYPVIYLTDAWYSFQIVSGATRFPMNIGKMHEAIIVGVSYSKNSKDSKSLKDSKSSASRIRDYTPSKNKKWKSETGGAKQHMMFIEKIVFKYIEENYRTKKNDRTFVGNSLGGLFGTYILLVKPGLFNNYIIGSPSYWYDNKYIFKLESELSGRKKDMSTNIFISIGERESKAFDSNYEMVNDAKDFYTKILAWNQKNLKIKLMVIPEASHETAFPTTVIQGLYWLYKK